MGMRKNDTLIACLEKESLPFILIGTYGSDGESDFCQIDVDNKALAKEAVQHLSLIHIYIHHLQCHRKRS